MGMSGYVTSDNLDNNYFFYKRSLDDNTSHFHI